ncbi:hypothetical protein IFS44_13035 [Sphingomonas sp. CFBP 13706]|nr:hypothetical protein [Sphingomonas sp. CFBP 13706]
MTAAEKARSEWLATVEAFEAATSWKGWKQRASRRTLLRDLYVLMQTTPGNLLQKFDDFDEAELERRARHIMCHMGAREKCSVATPAEEALMRCGVMLRALDELLLEGDEHIADDAPECWLTSDGEHYVIPTPRPVMREGGPRRRQAFERRGLLRHRVIPRRVDDVDIVVDLHPDVSEPLGADIRRTIGCGIFEGFTLGYDKMGEDRFIVTSVDCDGGMAPALDRHCAQAKEADCDVLIWPELTIPPDRVDQLRRKLSDSPLRTALAPIVVAGSWHVSEDGTYRNMSPVLDGRGGDLEPFGKSRVFVFEGRSEAIEPYGRIHVLVTDQELIAFAICKDFCDKANSIPTPVTKLDVDLVLVPSMGRPNTMTAHRDAADDMKVGFGSRAIVAQQTYPLKGTDAVGYLLRGLAEPRETELKALAGSSGFTTFQCEQKPDRFSTPKA